MLKSMTGYGRGESVAHGKKFTVELKALNHRFSEIVLRLPRSLMPIEDRIKRLIQLWVTRGRVDGFFVVEDCGDKTTAVKVDKALAASYYKAMKDLQEDLGVEGKIKLKHLVAMPGVLSLEETAGNLDEWWPSLQESIEMALENLVQMRIAEGERLASDLWQRVGLITKLNLKIRERAPVVIEEYKARLEARLNDFIQDSSMDANHLAAEVALFAERSNITEETVRLDSHLSQAYACFGTGQAVGRKLDFLIQEMNREINTIASKANDLEISRLSVEVKSELEKLREQVQNIE
ncbi:MAG: YicC family protein [Desulfotomaculaceae bacterium]|nr:YicC family protein [Desulfotomaculaceae bacterium]